MRKITLAITPELMAQMGLTDGADEISVATALKNLATKAGSVDTIQAKLVAVTQEKTTLEGELTTIKTAACKEKVNEMLSAALNGKKLTVEMKGILEKDYATNPDGLKALLEGMKMYSGVVNKIGEQTTLPAKYEGKTWDELFKMDALTALKKEHPDHFKAMWEEEHGEKYEG